MKDKQQDEMLGEVVFKPLCPKYSLTVEDVVLALYNHATKEHWSDDQVLEELNMVRRRQLIAAGGDVNTTIYQILEIGDVHFNSKVTPDRIDVHDYEQRYGSVRGLITCLAEKKMRNQVSIEVSNSRRTTDMASSR